MCRLQATVYKHFHRMKEFLDIRQGSWDVDLEGSYFSLLAKKALTASSTLH